MVSALSVFLALLLTLGTSWPTCAHAENTAWEKYIQAGDKAKQDGNLMKAEEMYETALAEGNKEDRYGYHVAIAWTRLGALDQERKNIIQAEISYANAIPMLERVLGPDHPELAKVLSDMVGVYVKLPHARGYMTAEALCYRVLAIREKTLGPEHPDVADSLQTLALLVYFPFGRLALGEPLLQRALAIREKALGPDHPKVAVSLSTLAFLYDAQGKLEKAEAFYKRALEIFEQNPGPDSPEVIQVLYTLGYFYMNEQKYVQAEVFFKRHLVSLEKTRGLEHPDVADALRAYSFLLSQMDRQDEAKAMWIREEAIRQKSR